MSFSKEPENPQLTAGSQFHLEFPHLQLTWNGNLPARAGIFLPDDYIPSRNFPLIVWFGAGNGSDDPNPAVELVGRSGFICAALPYSATNLWRTEWPYYRAMLREIEKVIPNINPARRICAGFSSGGAAISYNMGTSAGFGNYFHAFISGGAGWSTGDFSRLRGRAVFAFIGDQDPRLNSFTAFVQEARNSGMDVTFLKFPGGHELPLLHYPAIREWLRTKVVQRDLSSHIATMKSEFVAKHYGKAFRSAQEVTFLADKDSPEHARALEWITKAKSLGKADASKLVASDVPLAIKKQFVMDWRGCDFINELETQCMKAADEQLDRILSQHPASPTQLRKFISFWKGFPVQDRAIDALDDIAAAELSKVTQIEAPDARNYALKKFVEIWTPAPSAERAERLRNALAAAELAKIAAITAAGTRRAKLVDFVRNYADTTTEQEARAMLEPPPEIPPG